jgi:hypothetical protein
MRNKSLVYCCNNYVKPVQTIRLLLVNYLLPVAYANNFKFLLHTKLDGDNNDSIGFHSNTVFNNSKSE